MSFAEGYQRRLEATRHLEIVAAHLTAAYLPSVTVLTTAGVVAIYRDMLAELKAKPQSDTEAETTE
ncbi:hypothetical protein GBZ48_21490 [Azospirillum melinis]|uniref:Uncharacterized protein n=1 Tax=Azospirillum melinis TaxID=328839 RepID=A0ABX2KH92_9PROT|nr:hypothetical protein [Azospirillum melinis]MBP2309411.1 putative membrane protein (Fun14 family) [Azospirillum melinis]NUB01831.1 hypothetical protein [Azospirillum melinis]